jgi:hypothetical protein
MANSPERARAVGASFIAWPVPSGKQAKPVHFHQHTQASHTKRAEDSRHEVAEEKRRDEAVELVKNPEARVRGAVDERQNHEQDADDNLSRPNVNNMSAKSTALAEANCATSCCKSALHVTGTTSRTL